MCCTVKQKIALLLALFLLLALVPPVSAADPEIPTLVSEDHNAYLSGTGEGCFSPLTKLTRGQAAMLLYNCMSFKPDSTASFNDVPAGSWYAPGANALGTLGVISATGNFRADAAISRGELLSWIMFFFPERTDADLFSDVPASHRYADAIRSARAYGFVSGDEAGQFHPDDSITRAETVSIFNNMLGRTPDKASIDQNRPVFFLDVPTNAWYYYHVVEAAVSHAYSKSGTAETWTSFTAPESVLPANFTTTGFRLYKGYSYYYDAAKGDILRNTTLQSTWTFDASGKYTSGDAELDSALHKIISAQCSDTADPATNLRTIFGYCRDNYSYRKRDVPTKAQFTKAFVTDAAKQMISTGKGNCYSFSSLFYHLSRWLGYDTTLVAGVVLYPDDEHCWTVIPDNGADYIYDTQLEWRYVHDWGYAGYTWTFYHLQDTANTFHYVESHRLH